MEPLARIRESFQNTAADAVASGIVCRAARHNKKAAVM
jgi:hypothetical protein